MASIKSLSGTRQKWGNRAASSGADYNSGVSNPRKDWAEAAAAGEAAYKQAVVEAANAGRFGRGVRDAGTQKWQERAKTLGAERFVSGVQVSENAYEEGFRPFHETIAGLSLPPRGAKGSPANLNRVSAVANALRAKKVGK